MTFYLTCKAEEDLIDIARYTQERWGREQRDVYLTQIDDAFYGLAEMPNKGRRCDHIRPGYRKYGVGKHLIFYRCITSEEIEIVRVLHGSMDIEARLAEDDESTH